MAYSVNTGLLTSVCALCSVLTVRRPPPHPRLVPPQPDAAPQYATVPETFVYFAFYFVLSKRACAPVSVRSAPR